LLLPHSLKLIEIRTTKISLFMSRLNCWCMLIVA
jgi:hypothetical protein